MKNDEILTLQAAAELDQIHNDGKLFRALKAGHISKEEFMSSIFNIVQKKNAQHETQKLLFQIESKSDGAVGDYWEGEKSSMKDKIISKVLYDKNGEFNTENLKKIGIGISVAGLFSYLFIKKGFTNISNYAKTRASRKEYMIKKKKDERLKKMKIHYYKQLEQLNQVLSNADLTEENKIKYEKMKEDIEKLLNNDESFVGSIVEKKDVK